MRLVARGFATLLAESTLRPAVVQPRTDQLMLQHLSPMPGSHIKKQRVGRGGRRGGSSGRGNGGQKHHGKRPAPWFTGLSTNPLTESIPKWPWAPRQLKPILKPLNLDRLQHWIDLGRLDPTRPITLKELHESGILLGKIVDGVKLLGSGAEYLTTQGLRVEVTRASQTAIEAIERLQGTVRTVYHTREGIRHLIRPHLYPVRPPFERPVLERDVEYYADWTNRGYLSSKEIYEQEFKHRGYVADRGTQKQMDPEAFSVASPKFQIVDLESKLKVLADRRRIREALMKREDEEVLAMEKEQKERWAAQRWFPGQGDWKWVEVVEGRVISNFNEEGAESPADSSTAEASAACRDVPEPAVISAATASS